MSIETFGQPREVRVIKFLDEDALAAFKAMAGEVVGRALEADHAPEESDMAHYCHEGTDLRLASMADVANLEQGLRRFAVDTEAVTANLVFDNPPELIPRIRENRSRLGRVAAEMADQLSDQRFHMEIAEQQYTDPDSWLRSYCK